MTAHDRLREIEERVAGHTPGRWTYGENTVAGVRHYGVGIDGSHTMVALTGYVGAEDLHESIANACLIAAAPDLLAIARELDAENQRLKDIIMAGATGAGFDEVEMALSEAEKDVDRLTDELQEAVRLLLKVCSFSSAWDRLTMDTQDEVDAFLIRHEEEQNND